MGDEDEHKMEDMSGYKLSGVPLALLGFEGLVWVVSPAGSRLIPAILGMANWLTHNSLSPSFSAWFAPSPLISLFLILNTTIT